MLSAKRKNEHSCLTLELMKREYNLSKRLFEAFNTNWWSSYFAVKHLQVTHQLFAEGLAECPKLLSFCQSGTLLYAIYKHFFDDTYGIIKEEHGILWDWASGVPKLKYPLYEHVAKDMKFLKKESDDSAAEIVLAYNNLVDDSCYGLTGRTYFRFEFPETIKYLAVCPNNFNEILCACEEGSIYIINLTIQQCNCVTVVRNDLGNIVNLYGIWHHPLASEVCVACSDNSLRIYDKQDFEKPTRTFYWNEINLCIKKCEYNFDGSEILVTFSDDVYYLYRNDGTHGNSLAIPSNIGKLKNLKFFGKQSEFFVGNQDSDIFFVMRDCGRVMKRLSLPTVMIIEQLEIHPNLPVIAVLTLHHGVFICATEKKPFQYYRDSDDQCIIRDADMNEYETANLRIDMNEDSNLRIEMNEYQEPHMPISGYSISDLIED